MNIKSLLFVSVASVLAITSPAQAISWDPIGDIQHPGRVVENIQRETHDTLDAVPIFGPAINQAGEELDRIRIEANANMYAPALELWFNESRNAARPTSMPIPSNIRALLAGYYDDDILNRVRFKVGDIGTANLAGMTLQFDGNVGAVTLIDVVVFRNESDAYSNAKLWAHELKHVQQFRDWGTRDFAISYIRSYNGVESEAYSAENNYPSWRSQNPMMANYPPNGGPQRDRPPSPQTIGRFCNTPIGSAPMMVPVPIGQACFVGTPYGPVAGIVS
jgi:hypothetical protein